MGPYTPLTFGKKTIGRNAAIEVQDVLPDWIHATKQRSQPLPACRCDFVLELSLPPDLHQISFILERAAPRLGNLLEAP